MQVLIQEYLRANPEFLDQLIEQKETDGFNSSKKLTLSKSTEDLLQYLTGRDTLDQNNEHGDDYYIDTESISELYSSSALNSISIRKALTSLVSE